MQWLPGSSQTLCHFGSVFDSTPVNTRPEQRVENERLNKHSFRTIRETPEVLHTTAKVTQARRRKFFCRWVDHDLSLDTGLDRSSHQPLSDKLMAAGTNFLPPPSQTAQQRSKGSPK
jgi:hypothetical protein